MLCLVVSEAKFTTRRGLHANAERFCAARFCKMMRLNARGSVDTSVVLREPQVVQSPDGFGQHFVNDFARNVMPERNHGFVRDEAELRSVVALDPGKRRIG
jgi:hypothetical protein